MDLPTFLKFLHVTAAILWVGGGSVMILVSLALSGRATAAVQMAILRAAMLLGPRLFLPASLVTLASGLALVFVAGWGWQPFTVLGLVGIAFTATFGALYLGPSCERVLKVEAMHGPQEALPLLRRLQRLSRMDYAVQFAIVFLMVVKPGWQDIATFLALAALLALAGLLTFRPGQSQT
jgi:uncharacterized membrane protein